MSNGTMEARRARGSGLEWLWSATQPLMFGAAAILGRYQMLPATPDNLVRPLVAVILGASVVVLIMRAITRDWRWAGLLGSLLVLVALREALLAALVTAFMCWWLIIRLARAARGIAPPSGGPVRFAARVAGILALAVLGVSTVGAVGASLDRPAARLPEYTSNARAATPSIYLLMLDGYPREDTLRDVFAFDNRPFLDALRAREFEIAGQARSNYNKTWLTLASMLNGAYVEDLLPPSPVPTNDAGQIRWLHALIDDASFVRLFRDSGYKTVAIAPLDGSAGITSVDTYLDDGHLTEFEGKLISSSPVTAGFRDQFSAFLREALGDRITDALQTVAELAESQHTSPHFVLAHVHSPHPPFVFSPEAQVVPPCSPSKCSPWDPAIEMVDSTLADYRAGLSEHLAKLNELVLEAIDRIVAADPSAVVIVMSDHGSRYSLRDDGEHFRILLASRTPGHPGLIPMNESPVNVVRAIGDAYLGTATPALPYMAWLSDWNWTLRLTPVR